MCLRNAGDTTVLREVPETYPREFTEIRYKVHR